MKTKKPRFPSEADVRLWDNQSTADKFTGARMSLRLLMPNITSIDSDVAWCEAHGWTLAYEEDGTRILGAGNKTVRVGPIR